MATGHWKREVLNKNIEINKKLELAGKRLVVIHERPFSHIKIPVLVIELGDVITQSWDMYHNDERVVFEAVNYQDLHSYICGIEQAMKIYGI